MGVCVKVLIHWVGTVDEANELLLGKGWKQDLLKDDEFHTYVSRTNIRCERVNIQGVFVYDFGVHVLSYEHNECDMADLEPMFDAVKKDPRCKSMQHWGSTTDGIVKDK